MKKQGNYDKENKKWYKRKSNQFTTWLFVNRVYLAINTTILNTDLNFNTITLEGCRDRKIHRRIKRTKLFSVVVMSEEETVWQQGWEGRFLYLLCIFLYHWNLLNDYVFTNFLNNCLRHKILTPDTFVEFYVLGTWKKFSMNYRIIPKTLKSA